MLVGDEVVYTQKFLFFMERLKERERELERISCAESQTAPNGTT